MYRTPLATVLAVAVAIIMDKALAQTQNIKAVDKPGLQTSQWHRG